MLVCPKNCVFSEKVVVPKIVFFLKSCCPKCSENTIFETQNNEVSINLIGTLVFSNLLASKRT